MANFNGFPDDFFSFFKELKENNRRDWFTANKPRYIESVVRPMSEYITAVGPLLERISPHYRADPRSHNGSMFRIYRDTRFSKTKRLTRPMPPAIFVTWQGVMPTPPVFTCILKRRESPWVAAYGARLPVSWA